MSKLASVVLRRARGRGAAQPGVDVARGLLAVPDADRDGALARHHVAAGEHARAAGHQRRRHLHGAVALELHARHRRAGTRCRVSWPSARITVSAASVSNRPVGCG